jgi:hypothetical protein
MREARSTVYPETLRPEAVPTHAGEIDCIPSSTAYT